MIQPPDYLSSAALVPAGARSDYLVGPAHYEAVARRIVIALRGNNRPLVLVTGDPPADPQDLCEALGNVAGPEYSVIIISCGPALRREDIERNTPSFAKPNAASFIFVLDEFDRLSDEQIEDVYKGTLRGDRMQRAAVLVAHVGFLARLERPALHFLKEYIAAQFRFQEVGDDEAIAMLHSQLLSQRDLRLEARGFRRGMLVGLAAGGAVLAASAGVFLLYPTAEPVSEAPAAVGGGSSLSGEESLPPVGEDTTSIASDEAAPQSEAISALATPSPSAPPAPASTENQPSTDPPLVEQPAANPRLSAAMISELLARGDAFLDAGDITSARLYYERAADADSGPAALRMGETFDTVFRRRAVLGAFIPDPVKALFWYRRARELGVAEAERRIKALGIRPAVGLDLRSLLK